MARLGRRLFASLFLVTGIGLAGTAGTETVVVDCDLGDNLAKALSDAEAGGPNQIWIRGTCIGNFTIDASRVDLRGQGPGRSEIVSEELQTALLITGPSGVTLRDLTIRDGSIGVRVTGHDARVSILFSDISADDIAVWVGNASHAFLNGVDLHHAGVGLLIDEHSSGTLFFATSRDHSMSGATVYDHSSLHVTNSEISGNGQVGLSVEQVSTLTVHESNLKNNGELHAYANDRSELHIYAETTIGDVGDPTEYALGVNKMSQLQVNDGITIHGDVFGSNSSYFSLAAAELRGSVHLDGFSNCRILNSEIDGTVHCDSGADAACDAGAVALTEGCPSAEPICGAASSGRVSPGGPVGPRLDRLDRFRGRSASRGLTNVPSNPR
jgi:hypothetical protein